MKYCRVQRTCGNWTVMQTCLRCTQVCTPKPYFINKLIRSPIAAIFALCTTVALLVCLVCTMCITCSAMNTHPNDRYTSTNCRNTKTLYFSLIKYQRHNSAMLLIKFKHRAHSLIRTHKPMSIVQRQCFQIYN
jgi:hypothetical protein